MSDTIVVALISGGFTLIGTIGGIMASQALTNYRLKRLEEEVNKHNQVIERTFRLEGRMDEAEHELRDLKKYHQPH